MGWPDDQAFYEAIQNPQICFDDPGLKAGTADLGRNELPKLPSTGNYAGVYGLSCPDGRWAVRYFRHEVTDQQRRYELISKHLEKTSLPCMVAFQYLGKGIRVHAQWYPILKMEWVNGERLEQYVCRNLAKRDVLLDLARQWVDLAVALQKSAIAHGDLQDGNILVAGGKLRLIDYDGMFVPGLERWPTKELGHPNYQHPSRSEVDFGPRLDNFSAWVVFTSLVALSEEPYLWDLVKGGDEKLLFSKRDFLDPANSCVLLALAQTGHQWLEDLAAKINTFLTRSPREVPALDSASLPCEVAATHPTTLPNWVADHVPKDTQQPASPTAVRAPVGESAGGWLMDHLVAAEPATLVRFGGQMRAAMLCYDAIGFTGLLVLVAYLMGSVSALRAAATFASLLTLLSFLIVRQYRRYPAAEDKRAVATRLRQAAERVTSISSELQAAEVAQATREKEEHKNLEAARAKQEALSQRHQREYAELQEALNVALAGISQRKRALNQEIVNIQRAMNTKLLGIDQQRRQINQDVAGVQRRLDRLIGDIGQRHRRVAEVESQETRAAEARANSNISALRNRIVGLAAEEKAEKAAALRQVQDEYVRSRLQAHLLRYAGLTGVGQVLTERLEEEGVFSALDVSASRVSCVEGIGPTRTDTLVSWRREMQKRARSKAPQALASPDEQRIRRKYADLEKTLSAEIAKVPRLLAAEKQQIQARVQSEQRKLDGEEAAARLMAKLDFASLQQGLPKLDSDAAAIRAEAERQLASPRARTRELDGEEAAAKAKWNRQAASLRSRQQGEVATVERETRAVSVKSEQEKRQLRARAADLQKSLFQAQVEQKRLERESARYRRITFPRYWLRLAGLRRVA